MHLQCSLRACKHYTRWGTCLIWSFGILFSCDGLPLDPTSCLCLKCLQKKLESSVLAVYNYGKKSQWDTLGFLGHFQIHACLTLPLTPQRTLDACIQNFLWVSTFYRVDGGTTARKFRGCTVLWGNPEITEKLWILQYSPKDFCPSLWLRPWPHLFKRWIMLFTE